MIIEVPCGQVGCYRYVDVTLGTVLSRARCNDHIQGEYEWIDVTPLNSVKRHYIKGALIKESVT